MVGSTRHGPPPLFRRRRDETRIFQGARRGSGEKRPPTARLFVTDKLPCGGQVRPWLLLLLLVFITPTLAGKLARPLERVGRMQRLLLLPVLDFVRSRCERRFLRVERRFRLARLVRLARGRPVPAAPQRGRIDTGGRRCRMGRCRWRGRRRRTTIAIVVAVPRSRSRRLAGREGALAHRRRRPRLHGRQEIACHVAVPPSPSSGGIGSRPSGHGGKVRCVVALRDSPSLSSCDPTSLTRRDSQGEEGEHA